MAVRCALYEFCRHLGDAGIAVILEGGDGQIEVLVKVLAVAGDKVGDIFVHRLAVFPGYPVQERFVSSRYVDLHRHVQMSAFVQGSHENANLVTYRRHGELLV